MDSALEARVSDSNERLEEYLQGALRSNALESFALVAPHRDGYRVYVGEDVERPFAYVDVYLDGESLIVEGSSKRHLSEAEMGDLARFLGIDGKEAGMKLNRFRRFVDALRSMSGSDVDALRKLRISDCVLKEVRRTKVEDAGKTWPEVYLERLRSVPVPEGRGSLSEEEKERILDQRISVALSSIVSFLSDRGYRTSLDDLDITVEGADGKAYLHLNGMDRGNGFLSINIDGDPKTHYHDVVSVDAWFSLLKNSVGDRISDSQEPGEGFKLWADSESAREVPAELDIVYATADDAYNAAVNFVHSFDGEDFRVIVHVSSLSDEFEGDIVESFPKGSDAYREVYLGGIEVSEGDRQADSASSSLHLGDVVLLSDRADEPYRSSEFKIVDMNPALGLAGLMREGDSHIYPAPISELSLVSEQEVKNVPAGMLKDSVESDAELLESLRSDSSPANLKRVAHILKDQGRTSLKDGSKEVMAIAEYSNGQLVYSYKQKAWQEVKDSEDAWKDELREVYSDYEDGSILGSEIEERLESVLSDNDVPSDVADEIYGKIDEFVLARKHASRSGGRESDGREEFESWFSQFCSKLGLSAVADSAEKSEAELLEEIRVAGESTKTDLTDEEKQSGDYPKGVVSIQGLSIAIENPKGSTRSGVDADGDEWSTEMQDTYGYIENTAGADTDDIDVFVGEHPLSDKVFIVDQVKEDGSFDEHKVMLGYESSEDARDAYLRNYEDGWQGLGSITQIGIEDFRRWVEADKTRDKAFTEYIKVQDSNVRPQDFGQTHRIKVDGVYYTNGNTITVDGKRGRVVRFDKDSAEVRFDDGSTITVKGEVTKIPDSMSEGGVSTAKAGEEKYEKFTTRVGRKSRTMYQYDYRTPDGELFSCVAPSLEACRMRRDSWLEKRGLKVQDDDHFRDAKGTTIMLGDRVRVLNPISANSSFIGDFGVVEGLDDDGYIHVQLDNIDRPLMFDSREVVVINRKEGDSETMRIFGKDYKKGDTLVDSDGVRARVMYRDGNDAIVLTEEDNKWYRLPIRDSKGDDFVAFRDYIVKSLKRRGLDKYVDVDAKGKKGTLVAYIGTKKNPDAYADVELGENGTSLSLGWHTKPNLEFEDKEVSSVASMLSVDNKEAKRILKKFLKWVEWLVSMDGKDVIKKVSDAMDPNEDKDENIHVNWKISDLETYLRKPASMRRGKKVEDSKSIDKKALGEWLVGAADRAINSFGDGTVYYKDLGDGHSIVLDWVEGYDKDENNPFVKDGYGLEASLRKTKSSFFVGDWEYAYDDSSVSLEGSDKEDNGERIIDYLMSFKEEKVEDSKELPRRDFVFPADSTMVNDGKGHFPLNSLSRGRAALAFVARYDKLPKWYSGDMSLEEFKDHVRSEVKKAYPSIEVSDSAESGSGSFDFNEVHHDLDVALQKTRQYLKGKESESMTDADWDIAAVGSAISRAMRYLYQAARKQGQTTDYTNVKDACKVYDAKESTEDMWARICEADEITEREIHLLSRRLNAEGRDILDYGLMKNRYDLALTDEQERKALEWLNNQWKTSTGKERKNNPFGYREEQILDRATDVTFVQFYNAGNSYIDNFIPVYRVYSNDGSFEYYVQGGEISIVG